jgi:hypothetical protein
VLRAALISSLLFILLMVPISVVASTPFCSVRTPPPGVNPGPIGTQLQVVGNVSQQIEVHILFQNMNETSVMADSSGQFNTTLFVPPVVTNTYTISIEVGGKTYACSPTFRVSFGTDSLANMSSTIATINSALSTLATTSAVQSSIAKLQVQLTGLSGNLTTIRNQIQVIPSSVNTAQGSSFSNLNVEINSLNESISGLGQRIRDLNATFSVSKGNSSLQVQLDIASVVATIGVGAALVLFIQFRSKRTKRSGIDNWDIFD